MSFQLTLAARYLTGRKLRTTLTTLAVIFGVLVIFGMNIVLPTMIEALQVNTLAASGQVDVTITQIAGDSFSENILDKIKGLEGIRAISPSLNRTVNLTKNYFDQDKNIPDRITALALVGIDPYLANSVRSYPLQSGRFLEEDDNKAVVISQSLADALLLEIGDFLTIPTLNGTVSLEIVGILFPKTEPGNEELLVPLSQAQSMLDQKDKINALDISLVSIEEGERQKVIGEIQSALGDNYIAGVLSSGEEIIGAMQIGRVILSMFGVLALFMGAFIIFNTFRTIVVERRHDIGTLRALGASRKTIRGIFLFEGLLQGVIGTGLGLIFGYLMGVGVIKIAEEPLSQFINIQMGAPVVSPSLVLVSILLGVGVTVLAGIIPAIKASRLTPMEALRPSSHEVEFARLTTPGFITGVFMLAVALAALLTKNSSALGIGSVLFLIGMVLIAPALVRPFAIFFGKFLSILYTRKGIGNLAQGNLTRQPSRAAITASATMLGLAIIVAAGAMVSSVSITLNKVIHESLGSDYLFIPPSVALWSSNIGSNESLASELALLDGVEVVSTLRAANTVIDGQAVSILGINPETYPIISNLEFVNGDESAYAELANGRNLILNSITKKQLGLNVGDRITLITPNGEEEYNVVAIGTDILNAKVITVYMSQENLAADFDKNEDVFIQLDLEKGSDAQKMDAEIKKIAQDYPQYSVISGKEYADSLATQLNTAFSGMYFLLAALALPSLIAMLNTLAISVLERTREIGMLRAVGATRKQIKTMIVGEALLLAAIGATFGIAGGLYLGYILVDAISLLLPVSYIFPMAGILAAILIALVFGLLAAFIPARQASRLDVVKALRYE